MLKRRPGNLLQYIFSGGTVRSRRAETTVNMMGAMPAVAVRLERRKAEKRLKRPSQLYLGGYPHLRQQTTSPSRANSPTPSPLLSPPRTDEEHYLPEIYVCGKVSALHLAVVSLLLGAVILIVGLVQLKPGADAPGHRYYLIAIGCFLEILGLIITAARCVLLHWKMERRRCSNSSSRKCERTIEKRASQAGATDISITNENNKNTQSEQNMANSDGAEHKHVNLKHLYNSSDVMYIDEVDSSTGRRSKSPVESISTIEVLMGGSKPEPPPRFTDTCSLAMVSPAELDALLNQPEQKPAT